MRHGPVQQLADPGQYPEDKAAPEEVLAKENKEVGEPGRLIRHSRSRYSQSLFPDNSADGNDVLLSFQPNFADRFDGEEIGWRK